MRVLVDGVKTTLTLRFSNESGARGFQYLTPNNASCHSFAWKPRTGERFRTNGSSYVILQDDNDEP